jgi:cell division protein FtsL
MRIGRRKYRRSRLARRRRVPENRYVIIVAVILIIVATASFYIYQRVWVRNMIAEIEVMQQRNEDARQQMGLLRSQWVASSSIASIETAVAERKLALEPTRPTQIMALVPPQEWQPGRYAGLWRALVKIVEHVPVVRTNEAEAKQIFEGQ